jgi:hypothetical protein
MTLGIFGLPLGFEVTVSDGFTGLLFDIAGSFLKSAFDFAGPVFLQIQTQFNQRLPDERVST